MLKLLVFDLDGTLADTGSDLAVSVNQALSLVGHSPLPLDTLIGFLGDGAQTLITRSLMASGDGETSAGEIESALESFLEHYRDHCLGATKVYPGLIASLESLSGRRKAVLTNKPDEPARRILAGLGLAGHFVHVVGGDNPYGKKPDPTALKHIMEAEGVLPEETLMIGDGLQDLKVARRAGARFLGFTGGMAPQAALLRENPESVFQDMSALPKAVAALEAGIDQQPGSRP